MSRWAVAVTALAATDTCGRRSVATRTERVRHAGPTVHVRVHLGGLATRSTCVVPTATFMRKSVGIPPVDVSPASTSRIKLAAKGRDLPCSTVREVTTRLSWGAVQATENAASAPENMPGKGMATQGRQRMPREAAATGISEQLTTRV